MRALASEAAVGANRPDVGKEGGRDAEAETETETTDGAFFDDGVFGREPGVADGVGDLTALAAAALERGNVDGALRIPAVPFDDGVRGVGVLERVVVAVVRVVVAVLCGLAP